MPDGSRGTPGASRAGARLAVVVLLVAAPALLAVLVPRAADAHPFGPPPTAWVSHEGHEVGVVWSAAYDDVLMMGEQLGLLAEGTSDRFREAETQVAPPRSDEEALERSDRLRAYVTERIAVHQDGTRCEPRMALDELGRQGIRTVHRCPEPVDEVRLEITMLHDVNPAYRTFALADRETPGPVAIFSTDQPAHTLDLTRLDADAPGIGTGERAGIAGALLLVGAAVVWGFRRLTGSAPTTATTAGGDAPRPPTVSRDRVEGAS